MAEADPVFPDARHAGPDTGAGQAAHPPKRQFGRLLAMLSVPVLILIGGGYYWYSLQGQVSTDNAYVKQDKVSVSSEINGRIVEVAVGDNQVVKAGDLLFRIDADHVAGFEAGLVRRRPAQAAVPAIPAPEDAAKEDGADEGEGEIDFALEAALSTLQRMNRQGNG